MPKLIWVFTGHNSHFDGSVMLLPHWHIKPNKDPKQCSIYRTPEELRSKVTAQQHCINSIPIKWAPPSEFVSLSIPSWQILTAHVQPFRGARDLAFCLKVPLDSLLVWASCGGSGETARMRRLALTFAARIGDKYQIRLTRPKYQIPMVMFLCRYHEIMWYSRNGTFYQN